MRTERCCRAPDIAQAGANGVYADGMQQIAAFDHSSTASAFAGLLASLAAPPEAGVLASPAQPETAPAWNDDELADDVATLSYEQALRRHSRYDSAAGDSRAVAARGEPSRSSGPGKRASIPRQPFGASGESRMSVPRQSLPNSSVPNLKRSSITIRLSESDCAQIHERASEAGLTVSAYLRSCAFEVETLRTQVKETLARLRSPQPSAPKPAKEARTGRSIKGLWRRFLRSGLSRGPGSALNAENPPAPAHD
jgi:hypothetical protein